MEYHGGERMGNLLLECQLSTPWGRFPRGHRLSLFSTSTESLRAGTSDSNRGCTLPRLELRARRGMAFSVYQPSAADLAALRGNVPPGAGCSAQVKLFQSVTRLDWSTFAKVVCFMLFKRLS